MVQKKLTVAPAPAKKGKPSVLAAGLEVVELNTAKQDEASAVK
jgi:hypothetical protein